jgi:hypothetical protein
LNIESFCTEDFFVSELYFESSDLKSEWKTFFLKIGVVDDIKWTERRINKSDEDFIIAKPLFKLIPEEAIAEQFKYGDWVFNIYWYTINHFSFFRYAIDDYNFSIHFWNRVFAIPKKDGFDKFGGSTAYYEGGYGRKYTFELDQYTSKSYFNWTIENLNIIPTSLKDCRKSSEVFNNSIPQIKEIAGQYLPVLHYEIAIPIDWQNHLKFIPTLGLNEYLQILRSIWIENSQDEQLQKENQKRIGLIYEKLALMNFHSSEREKIKEWANSNRLLAKNGTEFYYPKDLSIVTIEGFRASHLVFAEKQSPEIIELLRLFGVQIIDKVNATISNSKVEITDLKTKLLQTSPLIALVAVEKSKNRKEWDNEYGRIKQKLSSIHFFETTEIYLSYGNEDDKQKRSSWAEYDNFYYVGKWYSPRVLDGLVEPLGNFLKIRYAERILTVLLLETFAGGVEYLKEKGFDISLIPDELLNPKEPEIRVINEGNRQYNQSDEDLGKQGELVVFEKLKQIYTKKYNQSSTETETGFKVGSNVEVFWRNKNQTTTADHDFKVVELSKEIYIDSKASTYGKNVEKLAIYISGNELNLMESADKYLIARVYNATSENVSVEFVRLQIDDVIT